MGFTWGGHCGLWGGFGVTGVGGDSWGRALGYQRSHMACAGSPGWFWGANRALCEGYGWGGWF